MKRFSISLVIGLLLVMSGCIFDSDDSDNGDNMQPEIRNSLGIGSIAAEYYPIVPDARWTYEYSQTEKCISKFTIDNTTYFRMRTLPDSDFPYQSDDILYWYDGNDVYRIIPESFTDYLKISVGKPSVPYAKITEPIHDPAMNSLEYRFNVASGTTWTVFEDHWVPDEEDIGTGWYEYDADDYYDILTRRTYVGKETVTTELGTFENCMKFKTVNTEHSRLPLIVGQGETIHQENHYESTSYSWFAPGIGLVRSARSSTTDNSGSVSYSGVRELTSYDIPGSITGYSIEGKVVDWDGNGISGVTVTAAGEDVTKSDMTDENGAFSIDGLQQGYYEVRPYQSGLDIVPAISTVSIIESDTYVGTYLGRSVTTVDATPPYPAETYLQFKEDATWTYSYVYSDSEGEPSTPQSSMYTCNGEVLHEESGEQYIEFGYEYYAIDGNDVYTYESSITEGFIWIFALVGKPAFTETRGGLDDAFDIGTSEMMIYTFDKPAGTSWSIFEASSTRDSSYVTICYSARYAGLETVETGAGTFEDCAKFELCTQWGMEGFGYKDPDMFYGSGSLTNILTRWFAPNVGLVKELEVKFSDGDDVQNGVIVYETGEFMMDEERILQAYSIP